MNFLVAFILKTNKHQRVFFFTRRSTHSTRLGSDQIGYLTWARGRGRRRHEELEVAARRLHAVTHVQVPQRALEEVALRERGVRRAEALGGHLHNGGISRLKLFSSAQINALPFVQKVGNRRTEQASIRCSRWPISNKPVLSGLHAKPFQ